jgi:hypothetical protein
MTEQEKLHFLERLYRFKKGKKFHFVNLEKDNEMEALISAAAVQITFGLQKYCMNFFRNIYIYLWI